MENPHTVIVVLEAKPNQDKQLEAALTHVAKLSREEDTNIEYRLHRSIENPLQFILYETWQSQEKHQLQFEKPYIKDLIGKMGDMLAKPYQLYLSETVI